jgi:hypothetical protein
MIDLSLKNAEHSKEMAAADQGKTKNRGRT